MEAHYGWLQFELHLFSDGQTAVRFIAGDVTNTPNEAATAGTGTIPEPSTVALLALAVTGMALLGRSGVQRKK